MEPTLKFLIEHGGFGSIFGLISGYVALRLWIRNNELQDQRSAMADQVTLAVAEMANTRAALERIERHLAIKKDGHDQGIGHG